MTPSPASFVHISNTLTYLSLLMGVSSIAAAMAGSGDAAGALIAAAAIADTFDGWFARRFTRSPELASMGVQLDSLADAVTFGIAPIVVAGILFRPTGGGEWIWWAAAFIYAACALTRLGFYNVWHGEISGFVGLPTPVAALFWSSSLLLNAGSTALTVVAMTTAVAMIAPVRIPRPSGLGLAVFVMWPVGLIVMHGLRM